MATIFERDFELHHAVERHVSKCYEIMDPNGHRQWARPSPRVFILKELNAAECEGLACETSFIEPPFLLASYSTKASVSSSPTWTFLSEYLVDLKSWSALQDLRTCHLARNGRGQRAKWAWLKFFARISLVRTPSDRSWIRPCPWPCLFLEASIL